MSYMIRIAVMVLVFYILATTMITTMVTGTSTGDVLIQDVGPLMAAVAVLLVFIKVGIGGKATAD